MSSVSADSNNMPSIIPPNIRWGIIGLGDVTEKKSGPPFFKCEGAQLVAVMRRTPGKAAEWAKRVVPPENNCVGYDNLHDFLNHEGLDAVYIATPPGAQATVCAEVAKAGKAVYVEKPVGRCAAETQAMMHAMEAAQKPFYTAYISRAYERTQAIRKLLQSKAIGDRVESIQYKVVGTGGARGLDTDDLPWRLNASQAGGGLIMDIGCHIIDRIDFLCGPLTEVEGKAENRGSPNQLVEDYVELSARIGSSDWASLPSDGASVSCTWDFSGTSDEEPQDELVIRGTTGSIKCVGMSPCLPVSVYDEAENLVQQLEFATPEHTAQALVQAVTDDLRGVTKADFLSYGDNAVRASMVLDKILGSYYGGREKGYWERTESWPGRPSMT